MSGAFAELCNTVKSSVKKARDTKGLHSVTTKCGRSVGEESSYSPTLLLATWPVYQKSSILFGPTIPCLGIYLKEVLDKFTKACFLK